MPYSAVFLGQMLMQLPACVRATHVHACLYIVIIYINIYNYAQHYATHKHYCLFAYYVVTTLIILRSMFDRLICSTMLSFVCGAAVSCPHYPHYLLTTFEAVCSARTT